MPKVFFSPLTSPDGLKFRNPGSWMSAGFNTLATLAKNLDTSKSKNHPDKLHSVPSPWARLLLFESALYDPKHPAHIEVRDQWRGLLGLIGLADVLDLSNQLRITPFNLSDEASGELKRAFSMLRPKHLVDSGVERVEDKEQGKWDRFNLIYLNGELLGATSPWTLVFTGIAHRCPTSIPFCQQGRLSDPAEYFRSRDTQYLNILGQWVTNLIDTIRGNEDVTRLLGERPSVPGAQPEPRYNHLIEGLEKWVQQIRQVSSHDRITFAGSSRFPKPYDFISHVKTAEVAARSDLFLQNHPDTIVAFNPKKNSFLMDATDQRVTNRPVLVYGIHYVDAEQGLPGSFGSVPKGVKVITDPADLFEDSLIEAQVSELDVTCLSLDTKHYLLPFRQIIMEYMTETELAQLVRDRKVTIRRLNGGTIRVEMSLLLSSGMSVKTHRDYQEGHNVISVDRSFYTTQGLAMWPDFACPGADTQGRPYFEHYFYYTSQTGQTQVEFVPLGGSPLSRDIPEQGRRWYVSETPLPGFVGTIKGKSGLLLINYKWVKAPDKYWKVGVDFGSTHTSVFYREVDRQSNETWTPVQGSEIKPLNIQPRVRILTGGDAAQIRENFFLYRAGAAPGQEPEATITTQLIMPVSPPQYYQENWLPREGQVFFGSLLDMPPYNKLETDLKWNADTNNHTASTFLRSLLILVEAEAIDRGARVADVAHAHPTAFPEVLRLKHISEWEGVARGVKLSVSDKPLSEAVAVCRHLWKEQQALPKENMVAIDIGGSTTDIAVWSNETLQIQESIKMAAGAASRLVESDSAAKYREWFLSKLTNDFQQYNLVRTGFSPDSLKRREYNAALKRLSEKGLMTRFIEIVRAEKSRDEVVSFLSPAALLFGALSYYAGLLTRKVGIVQSNQYYLYFCGKGGQLLLWLPKGEVLVQEMFTAGMRGPSAKDGAATPPVKVGVSKYPKEEVGRGLLIERAFQVNGKDSGDGMFSEAKAATVTAAEDGYPSLSWDENLNYERLCSIKDNLPDIAGLPELNNFVRAFSESNLTGGVAAQVRMKDIVSDPTYRNTLSQRFSNYAAFGHHKALIEPLFITEAKVLIEIITGRADLFD